MNSNSKCKKISLQLPKRVSELPPLEPESDSDTNENEFEDQSDNLNSNILNTSFIDESNDNNGNGEGSVRKNKPDFETPISKALEEIKLNSASTNDYKNSKDKLHIRKSLARHLDFSKITTIDSSNSKNHIMALTGTRPIIWLATTTVQNPNSFPLKIDPNIENVQPETKLNRRPLQIKSSLESNAPRYEYTGEPTPISDDKGVMETPLKSKVHVFETPMLKFQMPVSRGSKMANSKSRSVIEKEFRSQKILFTTPIAIQRPTITSSLGDNDSLSLSINDNSNSKVNNNIVSPEFKSISTPSENDGRQVISINGHSYEINDKIGSGGSSAVHIATELRNNIKCALKIVNLQGDKSVIDGYLNETKLLAKLQGNINVVKLYDYLHLPKESILYLVMEKGDTDLNKILSTYNETLPLYTLANYMYQMLLAVEYIHKNGVIHSDLKPANFLVVKGRVKLIDFGIASNISIDSTSIIKYSQAGTFNYISPEALIDTSNENSPMGNVRHPKIKISIKSDVWSLGCIFYLFIYRKTPFADIKNIYAKVTAITNPNTVIDYPNFPNYYPIMLLEIIKNCLRHNPKKRSSVSELLNYPFNKIIKLD